MVMQKFGYTYILTNKNMTALYCGVTSNLEKRLWEHKNKIYGGFTAKYNIDRWYTSKCMTKLNLRSPEKRLLKRNHD